MPVKRQKAAIGGCKARTKAGRACAAPRIKGGEFCSLHSNPERPVQIGRKGGLGNRRVYESEEPEVAAPKTAGEVTNLLADAMAHVRAGKMNPKLGSTLGYLGTSLLRAIEVADLEERVKKLETRNRPDLSPKEDASNEHS